MLCMEQTAPLWGESEPWNHPEEKSICVPFDSEEHYAACVADPESFRQHLTEVFGQHQELFPTRMSEGFVLHDKSWSSALGHAQAP